MTLKVGIIGTGWVSLHRHIPAYRRDHRTKIVALVDRSEENASKASRKMKIPKFYTDLAKMVQNEHPDIVSICTPPPTHSALAVEAMELGCHVITEKPMAMNVDECNRMIEASRSCGKKLTVNHNFLFSKSFLKVKAIRESGELGDVQSVHALQVTNLKRRLPQWYSELPGGLYFDEAPHMVYLLRCLLGKDMSVVDASVDDTPVGTQPLSRVIASFRNQSRGTGVLTIVFDAPRDEWTMTVVAQRKILFLDIFRDTVAVIGKGGRHSPGEVFQGSLSLISQNLNGVASSGLGWMTGRLLYGEDKIIRLFIDSLLNGSDPPISGEDGKAVVSTMREILAKGCPTPPR